MEWMLKKELVVITREKDGHDYICLTPKGVDAYYHLVLWLKEIIDDD